MPNIHLKYELTKTHPFIAKNTVTVLLIAVNMSCTQELLYKIDAASYIIFFLCFSMDGMTNRAMVKSCLPDAATSQSPVPEQADPDPDTIKMFVGQIPR